MELCSYAVIVDALFGTGLSGDVREPFKILIDGVNPTFAIRGEKRLFLGTNCH